MSHGPLPDLSLSNFSVERRVLAIEVLDDETGEHHFSQVVTLGPAGGKEAAEDPTANEHYRTLSLPLDGVDPGRYRLRVGDDAARVEASLHLSADGIPSFATASLLVDPDGSLSLVTAMR